MDQRAWRNVARNALRPGFLPVMAKKVVRRFREPRDRRPARAWARQRAEPVTAFTESIDSPLWEEAVQFGKSLDEAARSRLAEIGVDLGGGGHYPLMYFLVRWLRPSVVVETGVAAGWTSQAILAALEANGSGELYSSDFPYFRFDDPEQYVGVLVEPQLRERWHLALEGDERNLARFADEASQVDIVHYDSDKSARGRARAMEILEPTLTEQSVIVMDDIGDNFFFRDWVERREEPTRVFEFGGKYVGMVGL